jgi:hypothetical protein
MVAPAAAVPLVQIIVAVSEELRTAPALFAVEVTVNL